MKSLTVRDPNLTDCLRFLAACCIVFLHVGYLSELSVDQQSLVGLLQDLLARWALPFFYFTTARFALRSYLRALSIQKLTARVRRLLSLTTIYTSLLAILYLSKMLVFGSDWPTPTLSNPLLALQNFWHFITTLNPTSAHFLIDAVLIALLGYLVAQIITTAGKAAKICTILLFSLLLVWVIIQPDMLTHLNLWNLDLGHHLALGIAVGFLYELLTPQHPVKPTQITLLTLSNFFLLPIVMVGVPFVIFAHSVELQKLTLAVFGFTILFLTDRYQTINASPAVARIARWGQQYSLGIFVLHPPLVKIFDVIMPLMLEPLTDQTASLNIFFSIFAITLVCSVLAARFLYKNLRSVVTLH